MSRPYDEVLRQNAAMERVQELAAAHGFDADAGAQQAVYEVLLDYAAQERQGLIAALAAAYADVLARRGTWRRDGIPEAEMERALCAPMRWERLPRWLQQELEELAMQWTARQDEREQGDGTGQH